MIDLADSPSQKSCKSKQKADSLYSFGRVDTSAQLDEAIDLCNSYYDCHIEFLNSQKSIDIATACESNSLPKTITIDDDVSELNDFEEAKEDVEMTDLT